MLQERLAGVLDAAGVSEAPDPELLELLAEMLLPARERLTAAQVCATCTYEPPEVPPVQQALRPGASCLSLPPRAYV